LTKFWKLPAEYTAEFQKMWERQEVYFQRFQAEMEQAIKGGLPLGGKEINRAGLYACGTNHAFNGAKVHAVKDKAEEVEIEVEWCLGFAEHCDDCVSLAFGSPYPYGELAQVPGDGGTACNGNCKCYLAFRERPKASAEGGEGGEEEASKSVLQLRRLRHPPDRPTADREPVPVEEPPGDPAPSAGPPGVSSLSDEELVEAYLQLTEALP
jgi:hypothetical protein